ncbi:MAG: twin-arginine translocase subunit TatC, partial [Chlorobiales bacterium]|nr:twin-arginine translocase subunit TatC [Chlorobiales bacterium]
MSSETESSRPKSPASQLMDAEIQEKEAEKRELVEHEKKEELSNDEEMNFIGHLDELRSRLIRSGIALLVVMVLCAFFSDTLVNQILIAPLKNSSDTIVLQNLVPYGQISLYLQVIFFSGFILAFPFFVHQ